MNKLRLKKTYQGDMYGFEIKMATGELYYVKLQEHVYEVDNVTAEIIKDEWINIPIVESWEN